MTVRAPRLAPGLSTVPDVVRETNRAFVDFAATLGSAFEAVPLGALVMLQVPAVENAATFFPTTRRIYSLPSPTSPGTFDIRVYGTGQTIIQHPLGRRPMGRIVVGQATTGTLLDIDVAGLTPALDPALFVAFSSTVTALYRIVVF